jgi:putative MATE family efflux protein
MASIKKIIEIIKKSLSGKEYDYTKDSIRTAIILLAIPMILELGLESVFAVVDMYFVGHLPNAKEAITTVGLTESVLSLIYTLGIGLSIAATAVVARRVGEKNVEGASRAGAQAILLSLIIAIVVGLVGVIFAADILKLMGAKESVIADGKSFTQIMFASSPSIILLFLINGIFRGAGNAAMAMKSLWIASGINIILCPILIYGFGPIPPFGLTGAALATVVGRTVGVIYQTINLLKNKGYIQNIQQYFKWDKAIAQNLISVATPATFQFFIQSGSWIVLTYLVSHTGGTNASAGYQIAIRNLVFFILPAWGLSNAAATLVGQNLGAKEPQRAEKSVWLTCKYTAIFMACITVLFVFFSTYIIGWFTNDAEILGFGSQALQTMGYGFIFYGLGMVSIQALNGAGDTKTPTWINIICFWLFQIPLAWYLSTYKNMGPKGCFIAIPAAEILLACAALYFFKKGKWKTVVV